MSFGRLTIAALTALTSALVVFGPALAQAPQPAEKKLIDVPNDDGRSVAALFRLEGGSEGYTPRFEVKGDPAFLRKYELSEAERQRLIAAQDALAAALEPLLGRRDELAAQAAQLSDELTELTNKGDRGAGAKRKEYWAVQIELDGLGRQIARLKDGFTAAVGKLDLKAESYDALEAAMAAGEYMGTDAQGFDLAAPDSQANYAALYGPEPEDAGLAYVPVAFIVVPNPRAAPDKLTNGHDRFDNQPAPVVSVPLERGLVYSLRLALAAPAAEGVTPAAAYFDFGSIAPRQSFLKTTLENNLIFAVLYAILILLTIARARRNPNLFIRRISGLEAVDEAIGRATEMGKPVLYLNGMNDLTDLATLAAVNILGRVSGRIADYDSSLIVPCRDPVVMTVAQEVVREGYVSAGRPDAYRQDNIFFLTQDQFSYTASTCGIMLREKPAAIFLMGYYYAESLMLAETGSSVGAIQIAGTDSQSQLPFFITACDYTLIGEELYAASAYLSREPLLLGSLKGQDIAKGVMMLFIILQTLLFIAMAFNPAWTGLDFIKKLVTPL